MCVSERRCTIKPKSQADENEEETPLVKSPHPTRLNQRDCTHCPQCVPLLKETRARKRRSWCNPPEEDFYRNHGVGTPPLSRCTRANARTKLQNDTRLSTTMAFLPRAYALSTSSNSRTWHLGPRVTAALRNMSMVEVWFSVK